ncbi:MAG: VTT domain-containing protein [Pseudolabrys sp.]
MLLPRAENEHPGQTVVARQSIRRLWRSAALLLLVIVVLAGALALGGYKQLSLESLLRHRAAIAALVAGHPVTALAGFVACYALAAGLALPGVVFLTIGGGVFFGGLLGGFAAVAGATTGATAVFLLARLALRDLVMRWLGPQVARFAAGFRASGFNYLLFIRLVPIFPFSLGNLLPALCDVRLVTFVAATFIGITPMTLAIAFFGAGLDSALATEIAQYRACQAAGRADCSVDFKLWMAVTPELLFGLVALGVAALLPVLIRRFRLAGRRPS